jgi:FKBP-type peptidyl-prolyl cis-trans isomerase/Bacterial Ig-like domain (group 3)
MVKRRSRAVRPLSVVVETLESRVVLSGIASTSALPQSAAEIAARGAHSAATETTLAVGAGTLGQPITFTVTVRAPASAGSPQGTVNLVDHGSVIQTLTLSPTTSTNARSAFSEATFTLTALPGGGAYYFGKHTISAEFIPSSSFRKSTGRKTFSVSQPDYTTLASGVKVATIAPGSGPAIQAGQTASVLYTGYLEKNGDIFDDSINDGGTPLSYTVGVGQVIPGFDEGTVGMQVGETRIVEIPPAEGYGDTANGPIPANSTLIFVLTLEAIS